MCSSDEKGKVLGTELETIVTAKQKKILSSHLVYIHILMCPFRSYENKIYFIGVKKLRTMGIQKLRCCNQKGKNTKQNLPLPCFTLNRGGSDTQDFYCQCRKSGSENLT